MMLDQGDGAAAFRVIPAVDILHAEAVRLLRGDYDSVTAREPDPFALVERFVEAGAEIVHVVDLSAARSGAVRPTLIEQAVVAADGAMLQAAGGVRSTADAEALLAAGAGRVVVGTAAFSDTDVLDELVTRIGDKLVVAIDVRDGVVAVDGWTRPTTLSAEEAVARCIDAGVARLLCTAIERDGTLSGPSLELLGAICVASALPVIAAGGVRSVEDIAAIEAIGCEGAIVGRALLEGLVPLAALARATDTY